MPDSTKYEGTLPAMDSFKRYIRKYGIPLSVYGRRILMQFGRALTELQVKIAMRPKSRIERSARLVKDF
ncbi:MAG: hypothetical protein U0411_13390 [Thermodesulfovibrionales bacterium]